MDTEKKFNLKKSNAIGLFIVLLFVALGLVCNVIDLVHHLGADNYRVLSTIKISLDTILYLGIIFYAVYGYKIPHGNLLKYIMLGFAILKIVKIACGNSNTAMIILIAIACVGVAYIAGRLDRFKQNTYISIIIFALLIAIGIIVLVQRLNGDIGSLAGTVPVVPAEEIETLPKEGAFDGAGEIIGQQNNGFLTVISSFASAIQWAAISLAYLTRARLHKEAGLIDKEVKK